MESTLEKLKTQYPTLYIPAKQDGGGSDGTSSDMPDDVKPLSEASSVMEISRLVTHLTRAVASARERVSALMQELHPLKEKMVLLNDECDEKKKVGIEIQSESMSKFKSGVLFVAFISGIQCIANHTEC